MQKFSLTTEKLNHFALDYQIKRSFIRLKDAYLQNQIKISFLKKLLQSHFLESIRQNIKKKTHTKI